VSNWVKLRVTLSKNKITSASSLWLLRYYSGANGRFRFSSLWDGRPGLNSSEKGLLVLDFKCSDNEVGDALGLHKDLQVTFNRVMLWVYYKD
jgi:hypothetical protein